MEHVLEFNVRPMREIWQIMQLAKKKKELREKRKTISPDEAYAYIEMDELLEKLSEKLFENKE